MTNAKPASRQSNGRYLLYALVVVLAFLALKAFQNVGKKFTGTIPQEFPAAGSWLGVNQPLRFSELRGKVVLLQFSFVNCPYCREMDPHLHKWQNQLSSDGLVIIEIDDGNSDSLDEVRNWAASAGVNYPVYYDADGRMCASYGVRSFPTLLLVGRDGKVVWEGYGWDGASGVARLETEIRKALKQQSSR